MHPALLCGPILAIFLQFLVSSCSPLENDDLFLVQVEPEVDPVVAAEAIGAKYVRPLLNLKYHHLIKLHKGSDDSVQSSIRKRGIDAGILELERQTPRWRYKRDASESDELLNEFSNHFGISDPLFYGQWHIFNSNNPGHDLNLREVWDAGYFGENVTVAFVDDGIDFKHPDLQAAYTSLGSWDFNDNIADPLPKLSDDQHGTRCAGEVAAAWNDVCGVGIAPRAKVAGLRILSAPITDAVESEALNYGFQTNHIYSCSWGPADDGRAMDAPNTATRRALMNGVLNGRNGLGSIFVFASGNGGHYHDNCNFDGYTNSIFSATIGAVDAEHKIPFYSEVCAAQLVSAYSSGSHLSILTTNPEGTCTRSHGGTSAAAPLASAVYALALSIRPDLSWRDIQHITVYSASPFDSPSQNAEWQKTPAGFQFSHHFGFGKLDASKFVEVAKDWQVVNPQTWLIAPEINVNKSFGSVNNETITEMVSEFTVTKDMIEKSNFKRLEHVTVRVCIPFNRRGALEILLESPSGIRSILASERPYDENSKGFLDWTFMTVQHWAEPPEGVWKLLVNDRSGGKHEGTFENWQLALWGESENPSNTAPLPYDTLELPKEMVLGIYSEPNSDLTNSSTLLSPTSTSFTSYTVSATATPTSTSHIPIPTVLPPTQPVLEPSYREIVAFITFFLLFAFIFVAVIWTWISAFWKAKAPPPLSQQEIA
ncbi:Dibasic-processing endoprotease [Schizosaccharomyces pombe]|uniref:Dibasic-processing endoprotease n=1 Tax=Schizosaccharomyces pombe (strain 972 / ATCC 24843) TaxID=284812 RepID=KRP1_SCHPO|nr:kexin [Schizosaccharomyces pombe]Q09175.1 RecName: Full=Dibasic-processing endoprotease; AltName: Full=KEX2-related protease; Flags: Precursor [Schizosaccharomyces pombe 972h-]CAA57818.1 krp1 [Schizosaccharomyces pombe]CAA93896.1 kexin [Schizosaccharomyces pombe]|eukprot:NP_594835.1 kexin [Schizosaccharomyces pombe]